VLMAIY